MTVNSLVMLTCSRVKNKNAGTTVNNNTRTLPIIENIQNQSAYRIYSSAFYEKGSLS